MQRGMCRQGARQPLRRRLPGSVRPLHELRHGVGDGIEPRLPDRAGPVRLQDHGIGHVRHEDRAQGHRRQDSTDFRTGVAGGVHDRAAREQHSAQGQQRGRLHQDGVGRPHIHGSGEPQRRHHRQGRRDNVDGELHVRHQGAARQHPAGDIEDRRAGDEGRLRQLLRRQQGRMLLPWVRRRLRGSGRRRLGDVERSQAGHPQGLSHEPQRQAPVRRGHLHRLQDVGRVVLRSVLERDLQGVGLHQVHGKHRCSRRGARMGRVGGRRIGLVHARCGRRGRGARHAVRPSEALLGARRADGFPRHHRRDEDRAERGGHKAQGHEN